MKKRMLTALCSLFVFISLVFNVSAIDPATSNSKYRDVASNFANRISQNLSLFADWKSITLSDELYLYNETGNSIKAISYEVYSSDVNLGYIIIDYSTLNVLEISKN